MSTTTMWSMPLRAGLGSLTRAGARSGPAAPALTAAAPAAMPAPPSNSWRRVGALMSGLSVGVAAGADVRPERREPVGAREAEMPVAVCTALGDAEQVLEGSQQRVVVVRR